MTNRPWWRHWHVSGHDVGYSLREARMVAALEAVYWPVEIMRCDVDHSGTFVVAAGREVFVPITESEARVLDGNR